MSKKPELTTTSPTDDDKEETSSTYSELQDGIDILRKFFEQKLGIGESVVDKTVQVLHTVDIEGIVRHWKNGGFKNIVTMVGAGISTSAGIPDFRTKGTGLYNNLQKYKLPYPTAVFEVDYFLKRPKPFFALAKDLYPGHFKPTPCHYFIKMLHDKGLLLRHYTQNIDTLERLVGIPDDKLVEAHGTFYTNHCLSCRKDYTMEWMKEKIFKDVIPRCIDCDSLVKPDIVFFGENLPDKFYKLPQEDFEKCDLLIIMGTSLEVQPFASLIDRVNDKCVRLLINREPVGTGGAMSFIGSDGLHYGKSNNKRDVLWLGNCDDGVNFLAKEIGFKDELDNLIEEEYAKIDKENESVKESAASSSD